MKNLKKYIAGCISAALAASIAVGRPGAADSIPVKQEVDSTEKSL